MPVMGAIVLASFVPIPIKADFKGGVLGSLPNQAKFKFQETSRNMGCRCLEFTENVNNLLAIHIARASFPGAIFVSIKVCYVKSVMFSLFVNIIIHVPEYQTGLENMK